MGHIEIRHKGTHSDLIEIVMISVKNEMGIFIYFLEYQNVKLEYCKRQSIRQL